MRKILFLLLLVSTTAFAFLKADGKKIVDENGDNVLLRGFGLGGWMLQEGYMMGTSSFANTQHELKVKIKELIGEDGMDEFYDAWLFNFCQKIDVDSLAAWGLNSVRLPMHYNLFTLPIEDEPIRYQNTWLEKGFELTDQLLEWCEANELYLILDLHAAPGGQGEDAAISDYDPSMPSLWESRENQYKTVALWKKLAERYADEKWIGGYDLINETNWGMNNNKPLKDLYLDITEAIREVDQNHIIFIEGNWWANDFTGLTPPWDDNMVYSFHKYWSYNDQQTIQWMINLRNTHNIPIWCGETGENSNVWFTDAVRLFERNNIGWAWWPMKRIDSITSPYSITKPAGYQKLLNYWEGSGPKPSTTEAKQGLLDLAENSKLQNCVFRKDVVDALVRQPKEFTTIPFAENSVPGIVYATDFDLGGNNYAYYDTQVANYQVSSGDFTAWNTGYGYRNDGVDIQACSDVLHTNGYNVGWIAQNEWMKYTLNVQNSGLYTINVRIASESGGGEFAFKINGEANGLKKSVSSTGGWQVWNQVSLEDVELSKGENELQFIVNRDGFNLNYFEFVLTDNYDPKPAQSTSVAVSASYPNPFINSTKIKVTLEETATVKASVYNILGNKVNTLHDGILESGEHEITWNGTNAAGNPVASGVYFIKVKSGKKDEIVKVVLSR